MYTQATNIIPLHSNADAQDSTVKPYSIAEEATLLYTTN